jgi:hypothetical protein
MTHQTTTIAPARRPTKTCATRHAALGVARRGPGFTFVEVLFAILILGVGSIMIAGMLPVAIKQTSDTRNALAGQAACDAGYAHIVTLLNASRIYGLPDGSGVPISVPNVPGLGTSPGRIVPLGYSTLSSNPVALFDMQRVTGARIVGRDPLIQWAGFYGHAPQSSKAKLILVALRHQNTDAAPTYTAQMLTNGFNEPHLLDSVDILDGGALEPDTIAFIGPTAQQIDAAGTGAFIIIANSPAPGTNADNERPYRNNGRVFRLGNRRVDLDPSRGGPTWELQAGYDLPALKSGADALPNTPDDVPDASMTGGGNRPQAWMIGRQLANPLATTGWNPTSNPYLGLAQDVAVLTVDVPVNR